MDINTRLDGFIIHPLDAFNDKHQEDSSFKFSNTAPHLDGFQVHPLDNFISKEHSNNNYDFTNNNNNNYFTSNETYDTGNTFNTNNISNIGFDQPQIKNLTTTNDYNYNYDQYNNTSNYNNYNITVSPVTYTEPTTNYNYLNTTTPTTTYNYINTTTTPTTNYNYINTTTSNVISSNQEPNYINNNINTTNYSYENYPTTNYNYSQILPTKYLPTIEKTSNNNNNDNNNNFYSNIQFSSSTPNIEPITPKKIISTTSSLISPIKNTYSISSYKTTTKRAFTPAPKMIKHSKLKSSSFLPFSSMSYKRSPYTFRHFTSTYNANKIHHKPSLSQYKTISYVLKPKTYRITTFNPQIKWKKIIPTRTTIVIPTVKKYIIPRKSNYVLPKSQSVILQKSVIVQPQQSIQVMNIQSQFPQDSTKRVVINPVILNEYHSKILVPSIPVVNQNPLTVVVNRRKNFPMDNISSSRIITDYNLNKAKIYYPRNYEILKKKNF